VKQPRSWWSGLLCSTCGRRVVVGEDRGLYRCILEKRGHIVRSEAVCGACRDRELRKAAA
jgi:hypothetical protein